MPLSKENVEELLARDLAIPLELAPGWLWRLVNPHPPIEEMVMPKSEEEMGEQF